MACAGRVKGKQKDLTGGTSSGQGLLVAGRLSRELLAVQQQHGMICAERRRRAGDCDESSFVKARILSSMRKVRALFSSFDEERRGVVSRMGFGGLLDVPLGTEADESFSLWLVRSVEDSEGDGMKIHTRNVGSLTMRAVDAYMIIGVPFEGKEVEFHDKVANGSLVRFIRKTMQLDQAGDNEDITMAEVESVLARRHVECMTYGQLHAFKVAVAIFVVSQFLAPVGDGPDIVNTEIFKSLMDPDTMDYLNWGLYAIKCLKRTASRVQYKLSAGASSVIIHGCPILLKVFYLDNMDFAGDSKVHDVFPRINDYYSYHMQKLVVADTKVGYMSSRDMYGITKPRGKDAVCYSRGFICRATSSRPVAACNPGGSPVDGTHACATVQEMIMFGLSVIDQHADRCTAAIRLFTEAKAALENSVDQMRSQWIEFSVASADSKKRKNRDAEQVGDGGSRGTESGLVTAKMGRLSAMARKLVLREVGECSAQPLGVVSGDQEGVGVTPPGFTNRLSRQGGGSFAIPADPITIEDHPPVFDETPKQVHPVLACPGTSTLVESIPALEQGASVGSEPFVPPAHDVKVVSEHSLFRGSPFSMGLTHKHTPVPTCRAVMKMLEQKHSYEHDSLWFVHNIPSDIVLEAGDFYGAFRRNGQFTVGVVDALSRMFMTMDKDMYRTKGVPDNIWRHFLPASFAVGVADGEDHGSAKFRDMFIGEHLEYDVENCRLIHAPFPKGGRWVVYTWDFLRREVSVMDPTMQYTTVTQVEWEHDDTMQALHSALFDCIETFFHGWDQTPWVWTYEHHITLGQQCRRDSSGVCAMHYARYFDGDEITDLLVEDDEDLVRSEMLYQLLAMEDNGGDVAEFMSRCVVHMPDGA